MFVFYLLLDSTGIDTMDNTSSVHDQWEHAHSNIKIFCQVFSPFEPEFVAVCEWTSVWWKQQIVMVLLATQQ